MPDKFHEPHHCGDGLKIAISSDGQSLAITHPGVDTAFVLSLEQAMSLKGYLNGVNPNPVTSH